MIGLVMIVKNEAHVIERCLASVKPLIDWWVIVDTGSTDDTEQRIVSALDGVPGVLTEAPWVDFATNRNQALDIARATYRGYALTIDADEVLRNVGPLILDGKAGYTFDVNYDGTRYRRHALLRLDRPWEWVGPVHEYLHLPYATLGHLTAPTIEVFHEGARSRDPLTYEKDAALLEKALEEDPGNPRHLFYLAQSYKNAGHLEKAYETYLIRSETDGWEPERWFSLYQLGVLGEWLGHDPASITSDYLQAYHADPTRAEPLVALACYERLRERFAVALLYARAAVRIGEPEDGLFVDRSAYGARAYDELAMSAYYSGQRGTAVWAASIALEHEPEDERLRENLRLCEEGLTQR